MIDQGSGIPVVLIPGIQGRWEWMAPTVDALAARCRVLSFSLADEPSSGFAFAGGDVVDAYVSQIDEALDRAAVDRAVVIGVSYSGLVAAEYAARHPERTLGIVFASALPPGWTPDRRAAFYLRAPRLLSPLFVLTSPLRMMREVRAALPLGGQVRFIAATAFRAARWAASPSRMARRIKTLDAHRFADAASITAPALVLTGEDPLDRIVVPSLTRQYLTLLSHAEHATLPCTGHIGCVTRPEAFADIVAGFARRVWTDAERISA